MLKLACRRGGAISWLEKAGNGRCQIVKKRLLHGNSIIEVVIHICLQGQGVQY